MKKQLTTLAIAAFAISGIAVIAPASAQECPINKDCEFWEWNSLKSVNECEGLQRQCVRTMDCHQNAGNSKYARYLESSIKNGMRECLQNNS